MKNKVFDIAIIGGGLVGASFALLLQDLAKAQGWRICLIEPYLLGKGYQPSYDARATALSYGTRKIYERLSLWPSISQKAEPITHIHVSDRGHFGSTQINAVDEQVPALGYVVENTWLGSCLCEQLDQDVVSWLTPAQVTKMDPLPKGYRLTLDNGDTIESGLTILADGGRSDLREMLNIRLTSTSYGQSALIANVSIQQPHDGYAFERFTQSGPMAMLPLSDNRCALVWTRLTSEALQLQQLSDQDFLAELQKTFGYRLGAISKVGDKHIYPLSLVQAHEQIRPNLVLLGNSAHSLHPVAGQGYNLSLRDAQALAQCLAAKPEDFREFSLLQRYLALQQRDQKITVGLSDKLVRLFGTKSFLPTVGRNMGLIGLGLFPSIKSRFALQAMGLGL